MTYGYMTTLKDVLHEVVLQSPVPTRRLAEELGISYSMLMNASNPDQPEFKLQARLIVPITKLTGDTRLIEFLAQACGLIVMTLPETRPRESELHSELALSARRFGDLVSQLGDALADGRVSVVEAKRVEREGRALLQQVSVLLAKVAEVVK